MSVGTVYFAEVFQFGLSMKFAIFLVSYVSLFSVATVSSAKVYMRIKNRSSAIFRSDPIFHDIFAGCMDQCLKQKFQLAENIPSRPRELLGFNLKHCGDLTTPLQIEGLDPSDTCMTFTFYIYHQQILDRLERIGVLLQNLELCKNEIKTQLESLKNELRHEVKESVIQCTTTDDKHFIQILSTSDIK